MNFGELTKDIRERDIKKESKKLVTKWEKTKLLGGLTDRRSNPAKSNMARLLENQAAEIVRGRKMLNETSELADVRVRVRERPAASVSALRTAGAAIR